MKALSTLLVILLLLPISLLAQKTFKNEEDIRKHILNNLDDYDPIVGIYTLEGFDNRYLRGERRARIPIGKPMKYAIIRQGDCFELYSLDREHEVKENSCSFEATAIPGVYLWNSQKISFNSDGLLIKTEERPAHEAAQIINGTLRDVAQMQFKVVVTMEFTKLFPTQRDIQNVIKDIKKESASTGTGFALSSDGYIVTNYHVIGEAKSIKVRGINNNFSTSYRATAVITDKNNDLAILKINDLNFNTLGPIPYTISNSFSDVGESVFVLGYPLTATMGEEIKLTNGIISSKSGFQGDITSYQISAPVQPGNSGGPLFDSRGDLIGIINARHADAQNASYAVKTSYLYNLISSLPTIPKLQDKNLLLGRPLSDQVKLAKSHVYIIEVN